MEKQEEKRLWLLHVRYNVAGESWVEKYLVIADSEECARTQWRAHQEDNTAPGETLPLLKSVQRYEYKGPIWIGEAFGNH